ncbi:MAG TPA: DNA polymerase III subunit delta' [Candidatus Binatia bacterium]|nr:DNA polymerase III subunit delta' [Candidatus Binatia bacterium]
MTFADVVGHERAAAALQRDLHEGRIAGAYLFVGPRGIGKRALAEAFAASLLCGRPACGACAHCLRAAAGTHPDLHVVAREDDRRDILTEQVRELMRWLALRPLMAERKVALVDGAEHLNAHGQNALLKTLEEPPGVSVLLLVASAPSLLLPTVRSRCRRVRLDPLGEAALAQLLLARGVAAADAPALTAQAGGSLGRALELAGEEQAAARARVLESLPALAEQPAAALSALAQSLGQGPLDVALAAAVSWYRDVLTTALGAARPLGNPDVADRVRAAAAGRSPAVTLRQLALVCDTIAAIEQNANRPLALETLLLDLREAERGGR